MARRDRAFYRKLRADYLRLQRRRAQMDRALRGASVEHLYRRIYADLAVGVRGRVLT